MRPWEQDNDVFLDGWFRCGRSLVQLAAQLGRTRKSVETQLHRLLYCDKRTEKYRPGVDRPRMSGPFTSRERQALERALVGVGQKATKERLSQADCRYLANVLNRTVEEIEEWSARREQRQSSAFGSFGVG